MNDVTLANELPELEEARLADHTERKGAVVVIPCGGLRNKSDRKLRRALRIPQFRHPLCKKKSGRFDATDAGREKMAINQQRQRLGFWRELGGAFLRRRI